MLPLTMRQREAMIAIGKFIDGNKYPPSVRELGDLMGKAPATTHQILVILERKGYVSREASKPRALKILCRI